MKSRKFLVVYDSRFGATEKIARKIGDWLNKANHETTVGHVSEVVEIHEFHVVFACAPVYAGKMPEEFSKWIHKQSVFLSSRQSAFLMISLTKAGVNAEGAVELEKIAEDFLATTSWIPALQLQVAGALWYKKYNFLMRWVMSRIAARAGGDTDTSRNYEYTDWKQLKNDVFEFIKVHQALVSEDE
jgi:menaquinone-dependent protoporphyrinogen oxidase